MFLLIPFLAWGITIEGSIIKPGEGRAMPVNPKFTVGLVQMAVSGDVESNLDRAVVKVREAADAGAQVVCLPELFRSQYFCQKEAPENFDLAEPVPGPSTEALGRVARERKITIIAPIFERCTPGLYFNSAAILDQEGEISGLYRKMHIPDDPAYYEKYYFTPGDLGFHAFDTPQAKIGTLICWDQWYPEGARLVALQGACILFYPTAIGWHPHEKEQYGAAQRDAWITIQRSHAIANGVYVAAVNRVGHEIPADGGAGIEFWGASFLCDPFGVVIAQAGQEETILIGEVDVSRIEEVRRNWPFLRDRRIDSYSGICHRFMGGRRWNRT
jgi:N-carbamoylputrescine amidase